MTKISIIDQGKVGAARYIQFLFGDERKQVLAYPLYEDVINAVEDAKGNFKVIPLHERHENDGSNIVYFTNSLPNLCTSNKTDEIRKQIDRQGAKFTSKIHAKYHPDPERFEQADHECPYTLQNENYYDLLKNGGNDFFLLITTISKVAYNPQSLFANNVHIALNEAYYKKSEYWKNDFITTSTDIKRPNELSEVSWSQPENGYWQVFSEKLDFRWFKEIDDDTIQLPSTLEELLLNLLNLKLEHDEKIYIYSRDAYLSHSYLPKVEGYDYVNKPIHDHVTHFNYLPDFKMSNTKMERLNFLDQLLMFREVNKLVGYVAQLHEGEIALLLNVELNSFFRMLKNYRSGEMQYIINQHIGRVKDSQRLEFINSINQGRKRKFNEDTTTPDLVKTVMTDYYVNYLKREPWNRTKVMNSKEAFYSSDFSPRTIILLGTNYQFFQAMQLISNGKKLDYHSVKDGGIAFKNKNVEKAFCGIYIKSLKSLSNGLSVENVYVVDPMFNRFNRVHTQLFEQLSLKSINLDLQSFDLKDFN